MEQLVVLQPIGHPGQQFGVAQISAPTSPLKELLLRQLLTFFGLSLLAMLIGLFGFMPILKKTLVPLSNMVDTSEQIDGGNLTKRFPSKQGQMEIDRKFRLKQKEKPRNRCAALLRMPLMRFERR